MGVFADPEYMETNPSQPDLPTLNTKSPLEILKKICYDNSVENIKPIPRKAVKPAHAKRIETLKNQLHQPNGLTNRLRLQNLRQRQSQIPNLTTKRYFFQCKNQPDYKIRKYKKS